MKTIKKIGVLCAYDFPQGMAPTIRILAYCRGLKENDLNTEIFTFKETFIKNTGEIHGIVDGIPYHKSYIKHKGGFLIRLRDKIIMLRRLYEQIRRSNQKEKFDFILLSFDSLDKFYTLVPILKSLKQRLIFIGDEFPEPIRKLKDDIPLWHKIAYRIIHHFIDGRILMTDKLRDFYNSEVSEKPTFILNSIIDEQRFEGIKRDSIKSPYICYMGNMELAKDNVDNIIRAFAIIAPSFPGYELRLYGTPRREDRLTIESVIKETGTENQVRIMGRVDFEEVPQILVNAKLLVTSQPNTKRAEGGFPTKMAEYMMSKTPMLVTEVGEIGRYIEDGVNGFMVKPCNPVDYAKKMAYILTHPEESSKVAQRGYIYAQTNFCAKPVTKGMVEFLEAIKRNE